MTDLSDREIENLAKDFIERLILSVNRYVSKEGLGPITDVFHVLGKSPNKYRIYLARLKELTGYEPGYARGWSFHCYMKALAEHFKQNPDRLEQLLESNAVRL